MAPDAMEPQRPAVVRVGVQCDVGGPVTFYDPGLLTLRVGDDVVVPVERGQRVATVVVGPHGIEPAEDTRPLPRVVKRADVKDIERDDRLRNRQLDAVRACITRIRDRGLAMKVLSAEVSSDGGRVSFYFAAEQRVDFRELARDLAQVLHARVDMRQIGARDEARRLGAVGPCGRELCCASWFREPGGVSLKMAKAQGLAMTPSRLSGMCGRLKCCLRFEYETYLDLGRALPSVGSRVVSVKGDGVVVRQNLLPQSVLLRLGDGTEVEASLAELVDKTPA